VSHIMLASIGTRQVERMTTYKLGDRHSQSLFSCIALWNLLEDSKRPDKILLLLTPTAKDAVFPQIKVESIRHHIEIGFVELPSEELVDDSAEFLKLVADAIPQESRLTVDVTQGLRHHAFLLYTLSLYLGQFRDTVIVGAWYCRYEIGEKEKPFIDLAPVLRLSEWFHALGVFRETGSLKNLSALANSKGRNSKRFESFSSLFLTGMPLEAGLEANILAGRIESNRELQINMPMIGEIARIINGELEKYSIEIEGKRTKDAVMLSEEELQRQAAFIDKYLDTGQLNLAFGLMREWVINRIMLADGCKSNWLGYKKRKPIEQMLGGLRKANQSRDTSTVKKFLSTEHVKWAEMWDHLVKVRNVLQHHGMSSGVFKTGNKSIKYLRKEWPKLRHWQVPPAFGGGNGLLLLTPLGQSPGVLFSALKHVVPCRCMVVCSEKTKVTVVEAVKKAEWHGEIEYLIMNNPYTGIKEFERLKRHASTWLFQADEVHAGLTGGTSLMGALIGELSHFAEENYQRTVRKFVLIDKRNPNEQREHPWIIGEQYYLGNPEDLEAR